MSLFRRRKPDKKPCDECARLRWFLKQVIGEKERQALQLEKANETLAALGREVATARAEEAREKSHNMERLAAQLDADEDDEPEGDEPAPPHNTFRRRLDEVWGDGWEPPEGAIVAPLGG